MHERHGCPISDLLMKTEQRDGAWWVVGVPGCPPCGPYDSCKEAESDRIGMDRFERHGHKPGYMTSDSERK